MKNDKVFVSHLCDEIMKCSGIEGYVSEKQIGAFAFPMQKHDVTGVIEISYNQKNKEVTVLTGVNYAGIKDEIYKYLSPMGSWKWKKWSPNVFVDLSRHIEKIYSLVEGQEQTLYHEIGRDIQQTGMPFMMRMCDKQEAISYLLQHRDHLLQDIQLSLMCYHWNKDAETGFRIIEEDTQYWWGKIVGYYRQHGMTIPDDFCYTREMCDNPDIGEFALNYNTMKSHKEDLESIVWTIPPGFFDHKHPSAKVKIGNIYCFKRDDHKRYFQYVGDDTCNLNGQTCRMFKQHYPLDSGADLDVILKDDTEFYFQTSLKMWEEMGFWTFVGNKQEIGDTSNMIFHSQSLCGGTTLWQFQKGFVSEIPHGAKTYEGGIVPAGDIMDRMDEYDAKNNCNLFAKILCPRAKDKDEMAKRRLQYLISLYDADAK